MREDLRVRMWTKHEAYAITGANKIPSAQTVKQRADSGSDEAGVKGSIQTTYPRRRR
jgi:hypothetical protein